MPQQADGLIGLRILVVEDNYLLADELCTALGACGCEVVGPTGQLARALALAAEGGLHGAILDVNLRGEFCFPLAELLIERAIPFFFVTGYQDGSSAIPLALDDVPRLSKPVLESELIAMAARVFSPAT